MGKEKRENKRRASARLQVAGSPSVKNPEKQTTPIHLGSNEETQVSNRDVVSTTNTKDTMLGGTQVVVKRVRSKQPNKGALKSKNKGKSKKKQSDSKNSDAYASLNNESSGEGDYSDTESENDAPPTKKPRNFEGKKFLTETTPNFLAIAAFARTTAANAHAAASIARKAASIALCTDHANAADPAADAADAADAAADAAAAAADVIAKFADIVDIATDRVAANNHNEAVNDSEALCNLCNHPSGYFAALRTAVLNALTAISKATRSILVAQGAAKVCSFSSYHCQHQCQKKP